MRLAKPAVKSGALVRDGCSTGGVPTSTTPRARARADTIESIKRLALEQLATEGAAGLSLRAIARDLGVVSSAVYRYVPSRDELLTLLIVDAYDELADALAAADAACRRGDVRKRWLAVGRALRAWAVANPERYGLLYGTPVPGYAAPPERTVEPAARVPFALARLLADAAEDGLLLDPPPLARRPPTALRPDLRRTAAALGSDVPEDAMARGMAAWIHLFGAVSFELFGHLHDVIDDKAAWYDHQLQLLADVVGLP